MQERRWVVRKRNPNAKSKPDTGLMAIQNSKSKEKLYAMHDRGLLGDKSSFPVRFARVICAPKWPPASITLWEGTHVNNDTVEHGYLFM